MPLSQRLLASYGGHAYSKDSANAGEPTRRDANCRVYRCRNYKLSSETTALANNQKKILTAITEITNNKRKIDKDVKAVKYQIIQVIQSNDSSPTVLFNTS